jgi:type IX secretion system PorP/SprF family membrane protein
MKNAVFWICTLGFVFLLPLKQTKAQEGQLSQFFANPIHLNPALTGVTPYYRVGIAHRQQWLGVTQRGYQLNLAAADFNLGENKGGIGFLVKQEQNARSQRFGFKTQYAYHWQFSEKWMASAAMGLSYQFTNERSWLLEDELASGNPTQDPLQNRLFPAHQLGLNLGGLLYTEKFWIGAAVYSLPAITLPFNPLGEPIPRRYVAHWGLKLPVGYETHLMPAFLYEREGRFSKADLNLSLSHQQLIAMIGYRGGFVPPYQSHGVWVGMGWKLANWQIGIAYEQTIGGIVSRGSTYEITLLHAPVYDWRKKKGYQSIRCPISF